MKILTFNQAIQYCSHQKPKLLLGNGFSQACRPNIFAYHSLFERANFSSLSKCAKSAFKKLDTTDFEIVMDALKRAAILVELYSNDSNELVSDFRKDADGLREVLVSAIADSHPAMPSDIEDTAYWSCRNFLSNFDRIYSLNYDLLLYWTTMHEDCPFNDPVDLRADDGFRTPDTGKVEFVTWEIENSNNQNIFYLHGALHLFDAGSELKKYTWCNTGVRLIEQIRESLTEGLYPLFVAEGESKSKLAKIKHSDYMSRGLRSLGGIGGSLFIYGHSLAESDNHILKIISKGKVKNLFVSIYGDPKGDTNQIIMERARSLGDTRKNNNLLNVFFYDAESADVWGSNE